MATIMARLNYTTVTFDMRGVGSSTGSCTWRGHSEGICVLIHVFVV